MIKKILISSLVIMLSFLAVRGQETAMDFSQADCAGTPHNLYAELDAGKVVILEFVMLNCAPCITGTKALEKIRSPYQDQYPGRVVLYSMGFLNLYTCAQMSTWQTNNSFTHEVFTGGEQQVAYYGGMGMPTIVILGSSDHKVYFKSSGYTPALDGQINAAIDSALKYNPLGIREKPDHQYFNVYPTVSSGVFNFNIETGSESVISIFNITGNEVMSIPVNNIGSIPVDAKNLPAGLYVARLKTANAYSKGVKLIKQ